nr:MAG TPA: hypothetical protein [Caudoviricetes sp.]
MPFRGAGTHPQALKNGLFYWDGSPLFTVHRRYLL